MTIHSEHPFLEPEGRRDPARRFRGRVTGTVTLWTTGSGPDRTGLTVSSVLVAAGEPAHVLGLVDPDSDFADGVARTGTAVVQLLRWRHRELADVFAGVAPAPGGMFRQAGADAWADTEWGPVLAGTSGWAGVRLTPGATTVGWSTLLDGVVEHVEVSDADDDPLVHRRGRYVRPAGDR